MWKLEHINYLQNVARHLVELLVILQEFFVSNPGAWFWRICSYGNHEQKSPMKTRSGEWAGHSTVPHLLIHCCSKTAFKYSPTRIHLSSAVHKPNWKQIFWRFSLNKFCGFLLCFSIPKKGPTNYVRIKPNQIFNFCGGCERASNEVYYHSHKLCRLCVVCI